MRLRALVLGQALALAAPGLAESQRPGPPRILAIADLPTSFDTVVVERYLASIGAAIGRLAPRHPQLADWDRTKGAAWESPGLRRTRTELEYGHALTAVTNRGLNGRFGPGGFRLHVHASSARDFARVSGVSVGTVLLGAPLGGGCVVATAYSAMPRVPALEAEVAAILRRGLPFASSCLGPFDEPAYVQLARDTPVDAIDSTAGDTARFGSWVVALVGDSGRVAWEPDDCGEGGDGREAPTCVTAEVALRDGGSALVSVIVADLKGAPGTPRLWSAYVRQTRNGAYDDLKTLPAWAAAVRARRLPDR